MANLSTYQQKFSIIGDDAPNLSPGYAEAIYDDAGIWGGHYSLSNHLKSGIDDRLDPTPTGDVLSVFSTFSPTSSGSSVYNSCLWGGAGTDLHKLGWLGVVWYDVTNPTYSANGIPITRRHILTPMHGSHGVCDTVRWILSDGTFVNRRIIAEKTFVGWRTGSNLDGSDTFRVSLLDEDLPATIPIFRMFHPVISAGLNPHGVPVIAINQDEKASISDFLDSAFQISIQEPQDDTREIYYVDIIGGDSGSPVFVVYGSELIYIAGITQESGNAAYASNGITLVSYIASAVATLNSEHSLAGYEMNYLNVDLG